jgi:short-subunit dehydrogenase
MMDSLKELASKFPIFNNLSLSDDVGVGEFAWWSGSGTGTSNTITSDVFAVIGIGSSLFGLFMALKFAFALYKQCDVGTATTPSLPYIAFHNHVVWITGASSGIGRQMALTLCQNNCKLILSSRSKENLQKVKEECRLLAPSTAAHIQILPLDLSDLPSLPQKAKEANQLFDGAGIDMLINNGGVSTRAMAEASNFDLDEYITKVDYLSHVCLTKSFLQHHFLNKNNNNNSTTDHDRDPVTIINTGSIAGKVGLPCRTSYCGAKHALSGYMNALRMEMVMNGHSQVHIVTAVLGSIQTPIPYAALVNYDNSKSQFNSKATSLNQGDPNIDNGLEVKPVVERILAVAWQRQLPEVWMANRRELLMLYMSTYFPQFTMNLLTKTMGPQYAVTSTQSKSSNAKQGGGGGGSNNNGKKKN